MITNPPSVPNSLAGYHNAVPSVDLVKNNSVAYSDFITMNLPQPFISGGSATIYKFTLVVSGYRSAAAAQASKVKFVFQGIDFGRWTSGYPTGTEGDVTSDMVFTLGLAATPASLWVRGILTIQNGSTGVVKVQCAQNVAEAENHTFEAFRSFLSASRLN